jgi:hypothetical protein
MYNVAAILKMETGRNCSMSGINSEHHYLPTYQIFMISDNVEFLKTQNCSSNGDLSLSTTGRHFQNGHHNTAQIQHCPISTTFHMWVVKHHRRHRDFNNIIIYPHIKFLWYRTMLNFWKRRIAPQMVTYMYHYVKLYVSIIIHLEVININVLEIVLAVTIFKMAATIPHKFNIVWFQRHFICW